MSRLGIERDSGLVYEGRESACYLALPTPVLSQCTCVNDLTRERYQ